MNFLERKKLITYQSLSFNPGNQEIKAQSRKMICDR